VNIFFRSQSSAGRIHPWLKIVQAALDGTPDRVMLDWHPALLSPAASRYTASSPHLLAWLNSWNEGKPYEQQMQPFGFLLSFMASTGVFVPPPCLDELTIDAPKRGRPRKTADCKPIAPYDSDPLRTLPNVFDSDDRGIDPAGVAQDLRRGARALPPQLRGLSLRWEVCRSWPDGAAACGGDGLCGVRERGQSRRTKGGEAESGAFGGRSVCWIGGFFRSGGKSGL